MDSSTGSARMTYPLSSADRRRGWHSRCALVGILTVTTRRTSNFGATTQQPARAVWAPKEFT